MTHERDDKDAVPMCVHSKLRVAMDALRDAAKALDIAGCRVQATEVRREIDRIEKAPDLGPDEPEPGSCRTCNGRGTWPGGQVCGTCDGAPAHETADRKEAVGSESVSSSAGGPSDHEPASDEELQKFEARWRKHSKEAVAMPYGDPVDSDFGLRLIAELRQAREHERVGDIMSRKQIVHAENMLRGLRKQIETLTRERDEATDYWETVTEDARVAFGRPEETDGSSNLEPPTARDLIERGKRQLDEARAELADLKSGQQAGNKTRALAQAHKHLREARADQARLRDTCRVAGHEVGVLREKYDKALEKLDDQGERLREAEELLAEGLRWLRELHGEDLAYMERANAFLNPDKDGE